MFLSLISAITSMLDQAVSREDQPCYYLLYYHFKGGRFTPGLPPGNDAKNSNYHEC